MKSQYDDQEAGKLRERPRFLIAAWVCIGAVVGCWIGFLAQVHVNWDAGSYYAYGWCVVPMAGVLAYSRWRSRGWLMDESQDRSVRRVALLAIGMCLLAYLPLRLAIDLNAYWRLPLWASGMALVAASLLLLYWLGGVGLTRAFLFPVVFLLTMVPWPSSWETAAIQGMTRWVVAANTEALRLMGLPAEAQGNIILLGGAAVGVDEACSGIRSLQTLGMLALFVGALWQLRVGHRVFLLLLAGAAALVFNFLRSFILALCVVKGGLATYEAWHDPAGYLSLAGSAGTLLFAAWKLAPAGSPRSAQKTPHQPGRPRATCLTAGSLAVCSCLTLLAPTIWFQSDATATGSPSRLDLVVNWQRPPSLSSSPLEISPRVRETLGYDFGERVSLSAPDTSLTEAWYYGFHGGSGSKSIAAYIHEPTVCMTAAGARLLRQHAVLSVDLGPFALQFRHYTFAAAPSAGGGPLQVFWCLWEGDTSAPADDHRRALLDTLISRRRNLARSVILVGIHEASPAVARAALTRIVRTAVQPVIDGQAQSFAQATADR